MAALGGSGPAISGLAGVTPQANCASGLYGMGGNTDAGKLFCIDVSNGVATLLGTLAAMNSLDIGLDGDPTTGMVWAITNSEPSRVFAVSPGTLAVANMNNVTLDGVPTGGFESLAIVKSATTAPTNPAAVDPLPQIPATSPWALLLLALATGLLGLTAGNRCAPVRRS